ncbi:hypothetical protein N7G274_003422 [Stereocaulon virgatum]|uniref:Uncharacterized protein n=1 Tax=Stereocaulon virgatum TaxID=373712 RepID=A0ABR4ADL0_9LECA
MKWGAQEIAEIRQRLISNTTMLTAFVSTSQPSVELKLDKLLRDVRDGRREPSIASRQTVDSLTPNDKETWRAIRKELEDIGITIAAFDANKDFIFSWFTNAVPSGAFQEEEPPSPSESTCLSRTRSPVISSYSFKVDESDPPDVSGGIGPLNRRKISTNISSRRQASRLQLLRTLQDTFPELQSFLQVCLGPTGDFPQRCGRVTRLTLIES